MCVLYNRCIVTGGEAPAERRGEEYLCLLRRCISSAKFCNGFSGGGWSKLLSAQREMHREAAFGCIFLICCRSIAFFVDKKLAVIQSADSFSAEYGHGSGSVWHRQLSAFSGKLVDIISHCDFCRRHHAVAGGAADSVKKLSSYGIGYIGRPDIAAKIHKWPQKPRKSYLSGEAAARGKEIGDNGILGQRKSAAGSV